MAFAGLFARRAQVPATYPSHPSDLPRAGSWVAFTAASIAACALIISAGAQNVAHAYNLGIASSEFRAVVLALASAGASVLGPFAWLAVFRGRGFGTRVAALLLALGCLAYAGVCSLGFVHGSRDTAVAEVVGQSDAYKDKRAVAEAARAELAMLAKRKTPTKASIARSRELTALLTAKTPATAAKPVQADPQAAAVAYYLTAAGWQTDATAVGTWLSLGMVAFLEFAAALSLLVAAALRPAPRQKPASAPRTAENSQATPAPPQPETAATHEKNRYTDDDPPPPRRKGGRPVAVLPAQALDRLRKAGTANGVRGVAKVLGTSKSTAHRVLHQLAAAGAVRLSTGPHGVSVALV